MKPKFERLYMYRQSSLAELSYAIAEGYTEPIKVGKHTIAAEAVLYAKPAPGAYEIVCDTFLRLASSMEARTDKYGTENKEILCPASSSKILKVISKEQLKELIDTPDEMADIILGVCNNRVSSEIDKGHLQIVNKGYGR